MKREALKRLFDALEAIRAMVSFTAGESLASFLDNELLHAGLEGKFGMMGAELMAALAQNLSVAELVPELPRIISSSNRSVQVCESFDHVILWDAIQNNQPSLKARLESLLDC